jgi:hypothetical protein
MTIDMTSNPRAFTVALALAGTLVGLDSLAQSQVAPRAPGRTVKPAAQPSGGQAAAARIPIQARKVSDDGSLADVKKPVLNRGTVQALRSRSVTVSGRGSVTIGTIADEIFAAQRNLNTEVRANRAALAADPVVTEEVIETADETYFVSKTTMTVVDPAKLSPKLAAMGLKPARSKRKLAASALDATQAAEFKTVRQASSAKPTSHPLRVAVTKSDQELLDAVAAGIGDVTISSTVVVKKMSASVKAYPPVPRVEKSGTDTTTHRFLNGFTLDGDAFDWEWRWDFPGGYFRIRPDMSYELGVRIPMTITGTMDPKEVTLINGANGATRFTTELKAAALNADGVFFRTLGISPEQLHNGKELLLGGAAAVNVKFRFLGQTWIDHDFGKRYNDSAQFTPPLGTSGGVLEYWLPADVTQTTVTCCLYELAKDQVCVPTCADNKVTGSIQFGVSTHPSVGKISVDYEALNGGEIIPSFRGNGAAQPRTTVVFDHVSDKHSVSANLPAPAGAQVRAFGYRLSNVKYTWLPVFYPGIKGTIAVDVTGYDNSWSLDTWFEYLMIAAKAPDPFTAHAGTPTAYEQTNGTIQRGAAPALAPPKNVQVKEAGQRKDTPVKKAQ